MTMVFKTFHRVIMQLGLTVLFSLLLMACSGGETGTGFGEDTSTTVGRITSTGSGSVEVNGVEFDTNQSTFSLDGNDGEEHDLRLGMVVAVEGVVDEGGETGWALHIEYQDVMQAVVLDKQLDNEGAGILNIAGQDVTLTSETVFDSRVASVGEIQSIDLNNVVEVSGYSNGDGTVLATRIEVMDEEYQSGEEMEIKGRVAALAEDTFRIGALVVDFSNAELLDFPDTGMANGQYIEVISDTGFNQDDELIASQVRYFAVNPPGQGGVSASDNITGIGNGGYPVSVEGLVDSVITPGVEFVLNGQTVLITDTTSVTGPATTLDIVENTLVRVIGFVDEHGVITAVVIQLD